MTLITIVLRDDTNLEVVVEFNYYPGSQGRGLEEPDEEDNVEIVCATVIETKLPITLSPAEQKVVEMEIRESLSNDIDTP